MSSLQSFNCSSLAPIHAPSGIELTEEHKKRLKIACNLLPPQQKKLANKGNYQ